MSTGTAAALQRFCDTPLYEHLARQAHIDPFARALELLRAARDVLQALKRKHPKEFSRGGDAVSLEQRILGELAKRGLLQPEERGGHYFRSGYTL